MTLVLAELATLPLLPCLSCGNLTSTMVDEDKDLHHFLKFVSMSRRITKYSPILFSSTSLFVILCIGF